jgi:glycogenin glucosyltransferase
MIGPVRPNAIATLITTDDFLPGVQTLLYSLHQKLPKPEQNADANYYPPELIVLTTPNISQQTKDALHPALCTRLIEVDPIPIPKHTNHSSAITSASAGEEKNGKEDATDDLNASHVASWSDKCGYTKLHIFAQHVYDKILYLDSDCLVQKDVSHLLNIDIGMISDTNNSSSSPRKGGLIAAAPDIFPPDKFNAGVMLLQPSLPLFHDLMTQSQSLTTYDGGDTGFLNAYFDDWHSYPAERRLGFQYNAQRFMHQCTYEKQPKYWDVAVGDIFVIHFSSSPKP